MRRSVRILVCLTLAAAAIAGSGWYGVSTFFAYLETPGPSNGPTTVVLPRGVGLGEIVHRLGEAGVIQKPWLFQLAVRIGGHDRQLKAGEYVFPAGATPARVLEMLAGGETALRRLTVAEGLTVAEVYRLLNAAKGLTGGLPPPPPEGSLLPETYKYSLGDSRADLLRRMQDAMARTLDDLWPERRPDLPFRSPTDALTMASIVDKETGLAHERDQVAAVFVNRLRQGMKLQSDPTIIYALTSGQGPLDRELTREDWKLNSPYNTYQVTGLPPGPIGNPGKASIAAVLKPARVDYLYFVANGTGGHAFSQTLDEHNRHVVRWRQIRSGAVPQPILPSPPRPVDVAPPPGDSSTMARETAPPAPQDAAPRG